MPSPLPDLRFEADFLRTALLAGVVREADVRHWAEALLPLVPDDRGELGDVVLAPLELTAIREALRPLVGQPRPLEIGPALMAFLALDPAMGQLAVPDLLRVLAVLRREGTLASSVSAESKVFEDRLMLASVGMEGESAPTREELAQWLDHWRPGSWFRVQFARPEEGAAFLAAVSRLVVRLRLAHPNEETTEPRAWRVEGASDEPPTLLLNEPLWRLVQHAFGPLPIGSRIPYPALPDGANLVLAGARIEALGSREAASLLE